MLTPILILFLLAGDPPPRASAKPAASAVHAREPSPERVRSLQATIEKRRRRSAARHRIAEKNRTSIDLEPRGNTRPPASSYDGTANPAMRDAFRPNARMIDWKTEAPPSVRGDRFPGGGPAPVVGAGSSTPCFT
jgi:hypothetical protein